MNSTKLTLLILQSVCNNQVMNKSSLARNYPLYILLSLLLDLIYLKPSDVHSTAQYGSAPSDVHELDSVVCGTRSSSGSLQEQEQGTRHGS